jgi:UDP:flavonoid glycosyltransferase YjiC (YdhE family)
VPDGEKKYRILLAPLDWGLGHATRCIPLIRYFQQKGCEVVLAADGAPAKLLAAEFPGTEIKQLAGYHIRYNSGRFLAAAILQQIPHVLQCIKAEHQWLNDLLKKEQFDLIISDNRPGFYNNNVHSVYITHQLLIKSGTGIWADKLLQKVHAKYMKHFNEVWVPDMPGQQNLAGNLSHPPHHLFQPQYIGLLSRFEQTETAETNYDLLILLSGPEPQRTIIEQKIYQQLHTFKGTVLFVRGLPAGNETILPALQQVTVAHHLPAAELQQAIASSKQIICRSGYTSLMDLVRMKKKALLIPTPGQPEQEYLARNMQQQGYFPFMTQHEFSLNKALMLLNEFTVRTTVTQNDFEIFRTAADNVIKQTAANKH